MGRRYRAVCERLGVDWIGVDVGNPYPTKLVDGIIIATPTDLHVAHLQKLAQLQIPVLCEKPISLDYGAVHAMVDLYGQKRIPFEMVNQYAYMAGKPSSDNNTSYNYFKTGADGLAWDCINITGLAKGVVTLDNTSPIWECTINGQKMSIDKMDLAYVEMISDWLESPIGDTGYILEAHRRADEFQKLIQKGCHRYTGKVH